MFQMYNDPQRRIEMNIVGFMSKPSFKPSIFDITPCFLEGAMERRAVRIGWQDNFDIEANVNGIIESVRDQARTGAGITGLRIQQGEVEYHCCQKTLYFNTIIDFQLLVKESEMAFYAMFTMLDKPPIDLPESAPNEAKKPLDQAISDLQDYIKSGKFIVDVPVKEGDVTKLNL